MMEMVDTIMAQKLDEACEFDLERGITHGGQTNFGGKKNGKLGSVGSGGSSVDSQEVQPDPMERKYVYKAQAQHQQISGKGATEVNNFSMNKDLLREVLIKKMINDHASFIPYKDDVGALRHKTRELTLNTIGKFKSLKEMFSNTTDVIKESQRLATQFGTSETTNKNYRQGRKNCNGQQQGPNQEAFQKRTAGRIQNDAKRTEGRILPITQGRVP